MSTQYYIVSADGQKTGPYDIVGMVKKIRNHSLVGGAMVCTEKHPEDVKPIEEWPELADFLIEQGEESRAEDPGDIRTASLRLRMRNGWNFLQANQLSTIFSGLFVLFILFAVGIVSIFFPKGLQVLGYAGVFVITQFFFTGYVYSVLRMVRGQPVDLAFIRAKMKPLFKHLFVSSILMSFFIIIGLLFMLSGGEVLSIVGVGIVALPGFFTLSLFIFAPLQILDKGMDFWEAMETSRKTVRKSGMDNLGVIFALLIINFLAGLAFLIPMIVTLPITIASICDMYDESFS